MSALKDQIVADMTAAMKARDKTTTAALRMLKAAILTAETEGEKHELSDEQVVALVTREVKKRKESAQIYTDNGRPELAETELAEAEVFSKYLPAQLDDDQLRQLVDDAVAEASTDAGEAPSMKLMGKVMGIAKGKAGASVDGRRLSAAVKAALSGA